MLDALQIQINLKKLLEKKETKKKNNQNNDPVTPNTEVRSPERH